MVKIEVSEIQKFYNSAPVFRRNLSFCAKEGEIVFIYGKNGSGKTTLLRILAGVIPPDSGNIKIIGNSQDDKTDKGKNLPFVKKLFVGHEPSLYKHMKVSENLIFWSKIYGVNPSHSEILKSLYEFGVHRFYNFYVRELSQGTRKKVFLSLYYILKPEILIIDEPFSNLDEDGQKKLTEIFRAHVLEKKGILIFSSPDISDIEKISNLPYSRVDL